MYYLSNHLIAFLLVGVPKEISNEYKINPIIAISGLWFFTFRVA